MWQVGANTHALPLSPPPATRQHALEARAVSWRHQHCCGIRFVHLAHTRPWYHPPPTTCVYNRKTIVCKIRTYLASRRRKPSCTFREDRAGGPASVSRSRPCGATTRRRRPVARPPRRDRACSSPGSAGCDLRRSRRQGSVRLWCARGGEAGRRTDEILFTRSELGKSTTMDGITSMMRTLDVVAVGEARSDGSERCERKTFVILPGSQASRVYGHPERL